MAAQNRAWQDDRMAALQDELKRARSAVRAAEMALAAVEANAAELKRRRAALDAELEAARRVRRAAADRLRRAQEGFPALRQDAAAKRAEMDTLERRFDKVRWTLHELELEAEELKKRNREKATAIETARKRLKAIEHSG